MNIHANDRVLVLNPDLEVVKRILISDRVIDQRHWLFSIDHTKRKVDDKYFYRMSGPVIGEKCGYREKTGFMPRENIADIDWNSMFHRGFSLDEMGYLSSILYGNMSSAFNNRGVRLLEKAWGLNMANYVVDCKSETLLDFIACERDIYRRVKKFIDWTNYLNSQSGDILALVL